MTVVQNTSNSVFSYRNDRILPGETRDLPDEDANHLLETYPERFQTVGADRMQRRGRNRSQNSPDSSVDEEEAAE